MTSAYLLVEAEIGRVKDVLAKVKKIKGVECAQSVTGPYDIIAYLEAKNIDDLGIIVTDKIQKIKGVKKTITCLSVDL